MNDKDDFCPACGRVQENWGEKRSAAKGHRRSDIEDRGREYRDWRRGIGRSFYVMDIDQVEYRYVNGVMTPVLALELTRLDGDREPPETYFQAITKRFSNRDGQAAAITQLAGKLGVDAVIVLYRYNLSQFWLYNLTKNKGWYKLSLDGYKQWICKH